MSDFVSQEASRELFDVIRSGTFLNTIPIDAEPHSIYFKIPRSPNACSVLLEQWIEMEANSSETQATRAKRFTGFLNYYWEHPHGVDIRIPQFCLILGHANPSALQSPSLVEYCDPDDGVIKKKFSHREDREVHEEFLRIAQDFWRLTHGHPYLSSAERDVNRKRVKLAALAIDGGGVRGMVSALILWFVSLHLFGDERIGDRVDWISGVSAGAMTALALIKQSKYTPSQIFWTFWSFKNAVFVKKSGPWKSLRSALDDTAEKQTNGLEKYLQFVFEADKHVNTLGKRCARSSDDSQDSEFIPRALFLALNITNQRSKPELYRNFTPKDGTPPPPFLEFWEIARRSTAAPTIFLPHITGSKQNKSAYIDGGLYENAPVGILVQEIIANEGLDQIGGFLSVGTGTSTESKRDFHFKKGKGSLRNLSWIKDTVIERSTGSHENSLPLAKEILKSEGVSLIRLSPPDINVALNETDNDKLLQMCWATVKYLTEEDSVTAIRKFGDVYKQ